MSLIDTGQKEANKFWQIVNNTTFKSETDLRRVYEKNRLLQDVDKDLTEKYINRLLVNTIRHQYTNYDDSMKDIRKINYINRVSNYKQYKNIVLSRIADMYPILAEECESQKYRLDMCKTL